VGIGRLSHTRGFDCATCDISGGCASSATIVAREVLIHERSKQCLFHDVKASSSLTSNPCLDTSYVCASLQFSRASSPALRITISLIVKRCSQPLRRKGLATSKQPCSRSVTQPQTMQHPHRVLVVGEAREHVLSGQHLVARLVQNQLWLRTMSFAQIFRETHA